MQSFVFTGNKEVMVSFGLPFSIYVWERSFICVLHKTCSFIRWSHFRYNPFRCLHCFRLAAEETTSAQHQPNTGSMARAWLPVRHSDSRLLVLCHIQLFPLQWQTVSNYRSFPLRVKTLNQAYYLFPFILSGGKCLFVSASTTYFSCLTVYYQVLIHINCHWIWYNTLWYLINQ